MSEVNPYFGTAFEGVRPVTLDEVLSELVAMRDPNGGTPNMADNTNSSGFIPPAITGDFNPADINNAQIYQQNGKWYSNNPFVNAVMGIESGHKADAYNKSGATGLFQFIPSTWASYGKGNALDPNANFEAFKRYTASNIKQMQKAGIPVTPTNIYLAHQQGIGGLKAILKSLETGAPLSEKILRNVKNNSLGGFKGLAQFYNDWDARIKRG